MTILNEEIFCSCCSIEYHMIVFRSLGDIVSLFLFIMSLLALSRMH